jgi:hypothetical protein
VRAEEVGQAMSIQNCFGEIFVSCKSRIGHIIRHNEFVVNILEGAISGKKAVGRPRLQYLKQVARSIGADSYTAMERMACNKSRWKAANQSKD